MRYDTPDIRTFSIKTTLGGDFVKFGVHISGAGDVRHVVKTAQALECEAVQIFSRNPRGWGSAKPIVKVNGKAMKELLEAIGVETLVVHISYLVNLASPEDRIYKRSYSLLCEDLIRSDELGADYLVIHPGSHKGQGVENGIEQIASSVRKAYNELNPKVQILFENVAGAGTEVGGQFEELKLMLDMAELGEKIGICFDTCHAFVAGYEVSTEEGVSSTLETFNNIIGLEKIKLIHANDSKGALGSKLDRHEHIGKGHIGIDGFKAIVNAVPLKSLPAILETPVNSPDDDVMNLNSIRSIDESRG